MTLRELFEEEGQQIVSDLRASLDANKVNASGRLRKSIRAEVTDDRLLITAAGYALTAEDGRGPTEKPGDGQLQKRIRKWLDQKGIPIWEYRDKNTGKLKKYTRDGQAYVIARMIHKKGTKLFRKRGNSGVLSNVLNEKLLDRIAAKALREVELTFLEGTALQNSKDGISSI